MGTQELTARIKEYREYKRLAEEMLALAESIGDELKRYMTETGQSKAIVGEYKLSYTDVSRTDIDKKRLETEQAEIYAEYLKETSYKRFLVS
jgi:predicted phage-related endonuclease